LAGSSEGRYVFADDASEEITYSTPSELDSATKASVVFEYERTAAGVHIIWASDGALGTAPLSVVITNTDGVIQVRYDGSRPVAEWVASGGYTVVESAR